MTMVSEGWTAVRAIGSAIAAIAGRTENCREQVLTRAEGTPLTIIAGSPDRSTCVFMVAPPKALRLPA